MTKKIISILFAIILVLGMSVSAFANNQEKYVFDEASILTYDEAEELNAKAKRTSVEYDISTKDAKVRVLVIPTNEELMIARDTLELCSK